MSLKPEESALKPLITDHSRTWRDSLYVYPVISRRAGGVSIGINLNPDQACNFDCVYCQVDRGVAPVVRSVDLDVLRAELDCTVAAVVNGELFRDLRFASVPVAKRRLNDIAFSGDGEPTTSPVFVEAVQLAADARRRFKLADMKIVLITDATYLDKPRVREGLAIMDAHNGEIWAKLDAGTQEHFERINRPNVPLTRILENITATARVRPIVIQSLWMYVHGQPPPEPEVDAFAARLRDIVAAGGQLKLVQIYTIARRTAETWVTPLEDEALAGIAERVKRVVDVPTAIYGG
jgi:wyosine [tRNA(Phe)-imidazoG37] synthetase (radical SAM superfamily)